MTATRRSPVAGGVLDVDGLLHARPTGDGPVVARTAWPPPVPGVASTVVPARARASSSAPDGFRSVPAVAPAVGHESGHHVLDVLFLIGLAGVFLANALVGWLEPASFVQLAKDSRVGGWLRLGSASWLVPVICVNDFLVGVGVLAVIRSPRPVRRVVLAWAGLWLLAVTLLKLTALDAVRSL
jgi:hypothetical protein